MSATHFSYAWYACVHLSCCHLGAGTVSVVKRRRCSRHVQGLTANVQDTSEYHMLELGMPFPRGLECPRENEPAACQPWCRNAAETPARDNCSSQRNRGRVGGDRGKSQTNVYKDVRAEWIRIVDQACVGQAGASTVGPALPLRRRRGSGTPRQADVCKTRPVPTSSTAAVLHILLATCAWPVQAGRAGCESGESACSAAGSVAVR